MLDNYQKKKHLDDAGLKRVLAAKYQNGEYRERLTHISQCDFCAEKFADEIESNYMIKAPFDMKEAILKESKSATVQVMQQTKKMSKNLQLTIYSLKISVAVLCSIMILGIMPFGFKGDVAQNKFNMKDYIYGVKEKDTDAEENSVASVLHVTTNEMSSMLNEFSNQIMNGGN